MSKDERMETLKKMATDCAGKEGAAPNEVSEVLAKKMPSSKGGKCIYACIGETLSVMKDNKVDVEGVVNVAKMAYDGDAEKEKKARELANDCLSATDADRCEAAAKIFDCGHQAFKTRGFSFENL